MILTVKKMYRTFCPGPGLAPKHDLPTFSVIPFPTIFFGSWLSQLIQVQIKGLDQRASSSDCCCFVASNLPWRG